MRNLFLGVLTGLALGSAIVHFQWFPYPSLVQIKDTAESLISDYPAYLGLSPVNQRIPSNLEGEGVTVFNPSRSAPGNTMMAGVRGNKVSLWLLGPEGELLREWVPPTTEILKNTRYLKGVTLPFNDFFVTIHGVALPRDGGPVFTIANYALVKMDACGQVAWTVPTMAHHSVFESYDGTFWAATRFYRDKADTELSIFKAPYWEDAIIQVSTTGEVLKTVSLIDFFVKHELWGELFASQEPIPVTSGDIMHLNDVEILSPAIASNFPLFDAGDLMVSLRNPNMILVFDPESLELKWKKTGPWIRQHDPDFTASGEIVVFDNRNDGANSGQFGGSRLLKIKPSNTTDGKWDEVYANSESTPFFTAKRGLLDITENGNYLITESERGRVFEIDENNEIVWEFINRFDEQHTTSVMHAERYPTDHVTTAFENCD